MKETYLSIMGEARDKGIFVSFDPNYRGNLWGNRTEEFIRVSKQCIEMADFIKLSDEELNIITGKTDVYEGIKELSNKGNKIVAVTLGKQGTLISNGVTTEIIDSIKIKSIDSTGAGDAFVGHFYTKYHY